MDGLEPTPSTGCFCRILCYLTPTEVDEQRCGITPTIYCVNEQSKCIDILCNLGTTRRFSNPLELYLMYCYFLAPPYVMYFLLVSLKAHLTVPRVYYMYADNLSVNATGNIHTPQQIP